MKQTAIDWIEQKIVERIVRRNPNDTIVIQTQSETLIELFEQAKAMEKEQIENAYMRSLSGGTDPRWKDIFKKQAEQYYNETFKSE